MNKAKLLLVLAFIVVCAAGAVVGTAVDRRVRPTPVVAPFDWLTPEQAAAMKGIWSPVGELRRKVFGERRQLDHERRDEFEKLLTPEQLTLYKKVQQDYEAKFKALDDQLHQAEHDADAKSRALLTPDQLHRYENVRAKMGGSPGMGPPPGFGPPGMGPHPHRDHDHFHSNPATAPSTAPDHGAV
jgi:hypothetical protein